MAKNLKEIVVVDVESTCWEDGNFGPDKQSEIIEIGVSVINTQSCTISKTYDIIVKPEYSKISPFCTKLTSLTQEMVDKGISFKEACQSLFEISRDRTWASYGDYDRNQFDKQCRARNVRYPFDRTHINIKNLAALLFQLPREIGMDTLLKVLEINLGGTHHRAGDDSKNIANILIKILLSSQTDNKRH